MNKQFWAATFTLSGSIIGAGILGLPFVFAQSGFFVGLFWLVFLGFFILLIHLYLAEVTLRSSGEHQITGYAEKYLGKFAKVITGIVTIFSIFAALIAYLVGESSSITAIIPWPINPLIIGILFWFVMTVLLARGLSGLKRIETYGVTVIICIIFGLFIFFFSEINLANITTFNSEHATFPIGVVLFALLGFSAIPELKKELKGNEKLLKKAVIYGSLIPLVLYAVFAATFVGVLGDTVSEIATLSFGPLVTLLGIFTMLTSYLVLSFVLKDTFEYDLKYSPKTAYAITALTPLILYIIISKFELLGFSKILGISGVISATITGIVILLINKKSKEVPGKKPPFSLPINKTIIITISALFIIATILQFAN